jgi:hypothetical protein
MLFLFFLILRSIMTVVTSLLKAELRKPSKSSSSSKNQHSNFACAKCWEEEKTQKTTSEILKSIYTKEHTQECRTTNKKFIQKCRHCIECRGIPAKYMRQLSSGQSAYSSLRDKVLDMMSHSSDSQKYYQEPKRSLSFGDEVLIKVRTGPVPTSRWRVEESLDCGESDLLGKRERKQLALLNLPERYTNVSSMRVSAPSDMCMEKYSFAGVRALTLIKADSNLGACDGASELMHVIEAKEKVCQHGRYLETVYHVDKGDNLRKGRNSIKSSPQSVLMHHTIDMSSSSGSEKSSSNNSSGRFEGANRQAESRSKEDQKKRMNEDGNSKKAAKKEAKGKKAKKSFSAISSFFSSLLMTDKCMMPQDQMCTGYKHRRS